MKVSIIIPCYNEEKNIKLFYNSVLDVFKKSKTKYELIFVNDGSKDKTYHNLRLLLKNKTPIRIINFSRNFGKEAAILAGLKHANGEFSAIIDGDMQQDPKYILEMINFLEENDDYDSVVMCQRNRKEGFLTVFKKGFYKIINRLSDTPFIAGASDFRVMRKQMVDNVKNMPEYHRFSKGLFAFVGFNTKCLEYTANPRINGNSSWSLWKLFKYAIDGIIAFSTVPLRISTFIGIITAFGSIIYLITVIFQRFYYGVEIPGYATIVVLILFLGGLQLFALGIMGEYLARTYTQVKNRPIYITKDVLTNVND